MRSFLSLLSLLVTRNSPSISTPLVFSTSGDNPPLSHVALQAPSLRHASPGFGPTNFLRFDFHEVREGGGAMVILKFVSGGVEGRFVSAPWFQTSSGWRGHRSLGDACCRAVCVAIAGACHDCQAHMEAARCARRVVMHRSQCDFEKVFVE